MDTADALLRASDLPTAEARALLAQQLGVTREHLIAHPERTVALEHALAFRALAQRRRDGEPMAYLLGVQEFYGRNFRVSRDVLVPRPDTETLIDVVLRCLAGLSSPRVLELGTGSGCIAITLQRERADAALTATDASGAALAIARHNAEAHHANVSFALGDWYAAVPPTARFDAIVSNPPYIAAGDPHLAQLAHEPVIALTDGGNGLYCLQTIVRGARAHLRPGGWLMLEHGYTQGSVVAALLREAGFSFIATTRDAAGHERVAAGRNPSVATV